MDRITKERLVRITTEIRFIQDYYMDYNERFDFWSEIQEGYCKDCGCKESYDLRLEGFCQCGSDK